MLRDADIQKKVTRIRQKLEELEGACEVLAWETAAFISLDIKTLGADLVNLTLENVDAHNKATSRGVSNPGGPTEERT